MSSLDESHFLIHSLMLVKFIRNWHEKSDCIKRWFRLIFKKWFLRCKIPLCNIEATLPCQKSSENIVITLETFMKSVGIELFENMRRFPQVYFRDWLTW